MFNLKVKGSLVSTIEAIKNQKNSIEGKNDFYQRLAQLINSSIQIRVQKDGIGSDGKKMSPYSRKYEQWKRSKGRKTGYRDLTFTGNMFKSLTSENYQKGARMFFNSAAETNKARGNELKSPFFGISPREKEIIRRELRKLLIK